MISVIPLLLVAVILTLNTKAEAEECKAGYVLIRHECQRVVEEYELIRAATVVGRLLRISGCSICHLLRIVLIWFYFDCVAIMMGCSDGPFQLMLDALAGARNGCGTVEARSPRLSLELSRVEEVSPHSSQWVSPQKAQRVPSESLSRGCPHHYSRGAIVSLRRSREMDASF